MIDIILDSINLSWHVINLYNNYWAFVQVF